MFTFADQVDAMNEALSTERAEGEARGRAAGEIIGTIKTYRRIGKLPIEIISLIKADFDLKQNVAEKYVEETLGLQLA